jgi:hypothetical protein
MILKTMKKQTILSYIIFGAMMLSSCTKNLVENPKGFISPDDFFTTEAQCIQGVNGVYSGLYDIFGQEDLWKTTEMGTDVVLYTPANDANQEYTLSQGAPGNVASLWTKYYRNISRANLVINRVSQAPISVTMKARLVGETKFLRAMQYYMLSNFFGAVPLWTDELDVDAVSKLSRTPAAAVRKQIEADLTDAAAGLPLTYAAADVGRVTKGAALALLAKTYLFDKDWANAQKYAQQVVDANQYQLIDFANLFDVNEKYNNNKESIFEIQFKRDNSTNTNYQVHYYYTWFFPLKDANNKTYAGVDFGNTVLRGYENFYPSAAFVNMFDNTDKRKAVTLATGYNGQTFNRFLKPNRPWFGAKFWDFQANDRNSGKDMYFLRYADVLLILAEAENEQGNTTGALQWINKVRLEHGGLAAQLAGLGQGDIRNVLFTERAIEFAGEFQRKWDLGRWGKLVDAVKSVAADNPKGAANVKPEFALFPVPDAEIIKDPNLKPQNPGY